MNYTNLFFTINHLITYSKLSSLEPEPKIELDTRYKNYINLIQQINNIPIYMANLSTKSHNQALTRV